MSRRNRDYEFWDSARLNRAAVDYYLNKLKNLAVSRFEWKLPETIDARYLEITLFERGASVFFKDDVIGYLCLPLVIEGRPDAQGNPFRYYGLGVNGYRSRILTPADSVIIYNNLLRMPSVDDIMMFARRLAEIDRTIDVNIKAQKTPVIVRCTENQRLSLINLYQKYDGNQPFIFAEKGLDLNSISVLRTDAPILTDPLYKQKVNYWNEALTHLGISNLSITKAERVNTDEVLRSQGGTIASRYSYTQSREQAVKRINELFGLDVSCKFLPGADDDSIASDAEVAAYE